MVSLLRELSKGLKHWFDTSNLSFEKVFLAPGISDLKRQEQNRPDRAAFISRERQTSSRLTYHDEW